MLKSLARRISSRYAARAAKHGDLTTAERLWAAAIAYGDTSSETHRRLGELYLQRADYDRAGALLSVAASRASSDALSIQRCVAPLLQVALVHHGQGRLEDAERLYETVLRTDKRNFDALHLLGTLRTQQGKCEQAVGLLIEAVGLRPDSAEAHSNLGNALNEAKRREEAIASYTRAIALRADFAEAYNNLGNSLNGLGRHDEAIASCRHALAINAELAEAHYNIGNALYALERNEEAIASFRNALSIKPQDVEAHNNLGLALNELNRQDEAIAVYQRALALKPDFAEAHWNRGFALLLRGDLTGGWEEYEWRWQAKVAAPMPNYPQPLWTGSAGPQAKTVFLHADQGLGDTIQFVRYAPMVASAGARIVLQMLTPLSDLMGNLPGVERVISGSDPLPQFDCHFPLSSLPRAFGTTLENIPAGIPYLSVERAAAQGWRERLAAGGDKLVGICWRGNPEFRDDRKRSIRFDTFVRLLSVPGMRFVSLQKDLSDEERRLADGLPLAHPGADFRNTAEMIAALDLVLSVDTSWAHWAGAIGRPLWLLLSFRPDWRWMLEREDSPWYPSARLFRQPRSGDWDSVIERVRLELTRVSTQGFRAEVDGSPR